MGQGQSLEDPPPGPLPHSSLLFALGNLAVPAQFKVQTLELYKFAGLAAVGLRDPRILVLPWGGGTGCSEWAQERHWTESDRVSLLPCPLDRGLKSVAPCPRHGYLGL